MAHGGTIGNDQGRTGNRLPVFLLAALILAAGCGRQDRLVPVSPAQPQPLESIPWGTLVDEQAICLDSGAPDAIAAWSLDDFCFGSEDGMVIRIQGDEFRRIRIPEEDEVRALYCWPDGVLEAVDRRGRVWFRENQEWTQRQDLDRDDCRGVCPDDAGGLWLYGSDGMLVHQTGESWTDHSLPDTLHVTDAWVAPDDAVWLVTNRWQVIRWKDGDWSIESLSDDPPYYGTLMIAGFDDGTDDGRIAVGIKGDYELWFRDEGVWTAAQFENPFDNKLRDLYWQEGELYSLHSNSRMLARWDGAAWVHLVDLPDEIGTFEPTRACSAGGVRLIAYEAGRTVVATPSSLDVVSPPLGDIWGVVEADGVLHVAYREGTHLVRRDDHWQLQEPFAVGDGSLIYDGLGTDSSGGLVAVGSHGISLLQEGLEPTWLATGIYVGRLFRFGDHESVLLYGSDELMRLDGADLEQVGVLKTSSPSALCEDGSGGFYLLQDHLLKRLHGDEEETVRILSGWDPAALLFDPARGAVVAGNEKVLLHGPDGFRDVSPWAQTISGTIHVDVWDLCRDGQGGWLALSNGHDAILRFDGEAWSETGLTLSQIGAQNSWRLTIRRVDAGGCLIFSDSQVAHLVPGSEEP